MLFGSIFVSLTPSPFFFLPPPVITITSLRCDAVFQSVHRTGNRFTDLENDVDASTMDRIKARYNRVKTIERRIQQTKQSERRADELSSFDSSDGTYNDYQLYKQSNSRSMSLSMDNRLSNSRSMSLSMSLSMSFSMRFSTSPTMRFSTSPTTSPTMSPTTSPTTGPTTSPSFQENLQSLEDAINSVQELKPKKTAPPASPLASPSASPPDNPSFDPDGNAPPNPDNAPITAPSMSQSTRPSRLVFVPSVVLFFWYFLWTV
jgi:hypothetical protein